MTDDFTPDDLLSHPPTACQDLAGALRIPVALLTPSPLNPRKRWTSERVARMVASLRSSGQVQPIRVRPNPQYTRTNGRPPYEIVVGETRWRAAPEAGLTALDAVVGDYTDQQVIELGVVENTDRNDLHPLEEAEAYEALLRRPDGLQGYATVQDLAARFGQSPSYVYQRLKLRNLCPAGREAFLADKIKASVALLIARMPDLAEQAKATATLAAGWGGEPYSYRTAAELLQRDYMLALAKAPFDIAATYSEAGPCHQCPKRSGANPDLFADVTGGDMCQDARCYQAKAAEFKQAEEARQAAQRAEAAAAAPAPAAPTPTPRPTRNAPPPAAAPTAPARDGGRGGKGKKADKADAAAERARAVEELTRKRYGPMMFRELADAVRREPLSDDALRVAVMLFFESLLTYEAKALVYDTLGWPAPKSRYGFGGDFGGRLSTATRRELGELAVLLTVAEPLSGERLDADELRTTYGAERVLEAYGVDAQRWWSLAEVAASTQIAAEEAQQGREADPAAGVARRELTPTEAFVAQHAPGGNGAAPEAAKATRTKPAVKYRCPATGSTWTGRGLQPKWLKVALAGDAKLSDFEV